MNSDGEGVVHGRPAGEDVELDTERSLLQQAKQRKGEVLDEISHDVRAPLNAIMGFADLMSKGKVGPVSDAHKEYLGDILNSSRQLLHLLDDVIDLARAESGNMRFFPEPLNLGSVVAAVYAALQGFAASKRIRIETDVAPTIAEVVIDPSRLKQVLSHYVSNALKFTPAEGQVVIWMGSEGSDHFRIEIRDTGTAERFGAKVEFALAKGIVEAQGGRVGIVREPGQGSTVWVVLPRYHAEASSPIGTGSGLVKRKQHGG